MNELWATSTAGWITVIGFIVSIGVTIFAWGKWAQKTNTVKDDIEKELKNHKEQVKGQLDGLGGRVNSVESRAAQLQGESDSANNNMQRLLGLHDGLMKLIGEARGSTVQCREDTQALGEKIERKIDNVTKEVSETKLELSSRLAGVERELEMMRRG